MCYYKHINEELHVKHTRRSVVVFAQCRGKTATPLKCNFCGRVGVDVIRYRQDTYYSDEESNWVAACPECKEENDNYRWEEYYGRSFP